MQLDPEAFDFVPPQFVYPRESERLKAYMKDNKNALYIGKPQGGSQGDSMILFRQLNELDLKLSCT